jgi:acyl-CoA reductase-like NAD-dependent aldehyde dehydrogenase
MLSTKTIETVNSATGKVISSYETANQEEVNNKVKHSSMAFQSWQNLICSFFVDCYYRCKKWDRGSISDAKPKGFTYSIL